MRLTYRLQVTPPVELASAPAPERIEGVLVEWLIDVARLVNVSFSVSGVTLTEDSRGEALLYQRTVVAKVFAAARFVADRIRIQTGFDAVDPFAIVGNSPHDFAGESPEEEVYLQTHVKQHQRTFRASASISRPFDPTEITDFDSLALTVGHFARGLRTLDPLERYSHFYSALESVINRYVTKSPGLTFDERLTEVAKRYDSSFDRATELRELRNRVIHTNAHFGHISPTDIEAILQLRSELPKIEELVRSILRHPPA